MSGFGTTRGGAHVSLREAVFQGLAPDGGLYVPDWEVRFPGWPPEWSGPAAREDLRLSARWAGASLFPSLASPILHRVVAAALNFPVPLVEVEPNRFVLELFHGPTHAFKDVGARFLAGLMTELDAEPDHHRTVLVATSGDTGGAVASAFHGKDGVRVVALFPRDGVSELQRRQMTTLGGNVHAVAVEGSFDHCQALVKAAFSDRELAKRHRLTSANSINVARLLPQAFYYVHTARELWSSRGAGAVPRLAHFVVPSGNLGNLCSGLIAARAGMPHRGFTAALNANRGFADVLSGATWEDRVSVPTLSSAMDVAVPSNLERLRWLYGGDDDAMGRDVEGVVVDDEQTLACMADVYRRTGYTLDPHTAVAYHASRNQGTAEDEPVVVLGTAHPGKFPEIVEQALGRKPPIPPGLAQAAAGIEHVQTTDSTLVSLRALLEDID